MSKHTPGPWMVWNDGHGNLSVRSANERDTADATYLEIATEVGGLRTGPNFKDHSEEQANARLIAAAPELFRIVERLSKLADGLANSNSSAEEMATRLAEDAKKVVAKATDGAQ